MKLVFVEALDSRVSSIGFGSASLGSRIGVRKGLKTLERAYDAGITWYDVAPSYGDGTAESICGEFVSRKRDSIYVCTKVGMRPTNTSAAMRVLRAGPGCLDSAPLDLSGFLPGYAERGA
ncbi:aldo/keto reductase, partial [Bradyrhizobium liaoningense]|uniref:aldo/keto reductase n=1 Tax=Bradyrhizobium liaoningense TaxID=43992 RepID=UPI00201381FC